MRVNPPAIVSDNVSELLMKILDFTLARHRVLSANIERMHDADFVPMDMPVEEFANLMETAICEHNRSKRLLLCDTDNVKFGVHGSLKTQAVVDDRAQDMLADNPNEYLEYQLKKLSENTLNQKVAAELLKQKQGFGSILANLEIQDC